MNLKIEFIPVTWAVIANGRPIGTITDEGPPGDPDPWFEADPTPYVGDQFGFASRALAIEALLVDAGLAQEAVSA